MLGLDDYGSSEDEHEVIGKPSIEVSFIPVEKIQGTRSLLILERAEGSRKCANQPSCSHGEWYDPSTNYVVHYSDWSTGTQRLSRPKEPSTKLDPHTISIEAPPSDAPVAGPQLGPSVPTDTTDSEANGLDQPPQSPYSASRQAIRNLTLPPVANFNIPPSPPGSPPTVASEKFARFLELKKKGVHFNEKLESSSALRNPSLLQKLREFAGIGEEEQYASTLPEEVTVPTKFPDWAYADQLNRLQQETTKKREKERAGQPLDFVPATGSGASSRSGTPGTSGSRNAHRSAAERVMAGLDRESSSAGTAGTKRTDSGMRKSRFDTR